MKPIVALAKSFFFWLIGPIVVVVVVVSIILVVFTVSIALHDFIFCLRKL